MSYKELKKLEQTVTKKMNMAACELNFEEAAIYRDKLFKIKQQIDQI